MSGQQRMAIGLIAVWVVFWLGVNAFTYTDQFAQMMEQTP